MRGFIFLFFFSQVRRDEVRRERTYLNRNALIGSKQWKERELIGKDKL